MAENEPDRPQPNALAVAPPTVAPTEDLPRADDADEEDDIECLLLLVAALGQPRG